MKRWLGWVAIAWLLLLCALALAAYGRPAASPSLSDRTLAVARELRCPVCQGESVADSQSGISQGMRAIIRQRLASGQSAAQVKQYFVSRYGDKILLAPPASGVGDVAWFAPPLLVGGGVVLLAVLALDWRTRAKSTMPSVSAAYLERVRRELDESGDTPG